MSRPVGTLTATDLGKPVTVHHDGYTHTGTLTLAHHDHTPSGGLTFVAVHSDNGLRWMQHLPTDHPIDIQEPA